MTATADGPSVADIRDLIGRGEYLEAFDAVAHAGQRHPADVPESVEIAYLQALTLVRSGALRRARPLVTTLTETAPWDRLDPSLCEDIAALSARIKKDEAWAVDADPTALTAAARAYEDVHDRFGGSYSSVNAATLWRMAGRTGRSTRLARETLAIVDREIQAGGPVSFWDEATRGEALLVLGDIGAARAALETAGAMATGDLGTRAATRRQIRRLASAMGVDPEPLTAPLAPPDVIHYCGHMISPPGVHGRFPAPREADVAARIRRVLDRHRIGFAYGSLASGTDIMVAEMMLADDAELFLVMPFDIEDFVRVSVAPAGPSWVERFHACLDAATSVTIASDSAYGGDDVLFAYASTIAMGQTRNRAAGIDGDAWQLAVFDGDPRVAPAGTQHDIGIWRAAGGRTEVVPVESTLRGTHRAGTPVTADAATGTSPGRREIRSVLFGDFKGFSRLRDEHMDAFIERLLTPMAAVLDEYDDEIIVRNTWGDGLFVVLADAVSGARCAMEIQERLASIDLGGTGLPADMGMRLGGHTAPVMPTYDPVLHRASVMGRELTRTARIEPRTPVGEVYVTAAFAALLSLEPACGVVPEYVGHLKTAKDFETTAMYRLRR